MSATEASKLTKVVAHNTFRRLPVSKGDTSHIGCFVQASKVSDCVSYPAVDTSDITDINAVGDDISGRM